MTRVPRLRDLERVLRALIETRDIVQAQNSLMGEIRRDLARETRRVKSLEQDVRYLRNQVGYLTRVSLSSRYGHALTLDASEVGISSQHGEDGVLLAILDQVDLRRGRFLEIGCGNNGGNTGLLGEIESWTGVMIDADRQNIEVISSRFPASRVQALSETVTPENLSGLLGDEVFDVVSIDIDSFDLEIADSLPFTPIVLVIEYNAQLGPAAVQEFSYGMRDTISVPEDRYGASFSRISEWGESRGMKVVHVETSGTNMFLVRTDYLESEGRFGPISGWNSPEYRTSHKSRFRSRRSLDPLA